MYYKHIYIYIYRERERERENHSLSYGNGEERTLTLPRKTRVLELVLEGQVGREEGKGLLNRQNIIDKGIEV